MHIATANSANYGRQHCLTMSQTILTVPVLSFCFLLFPQQELPPRMHQFPPLFQQIRPMVSRFNFVLDGVRKGAFSQVS